MANKAIIARKEEVVNEIKERVENAKKILHCS